MNVAQKNGLHSNNIITYDNLIALKAPNRDRTGENRQKFRNLFYCFKWFYKDSVTIICNNLNQNRPIRYGDTAFQRCATSLRWAYNVTWRHRPAAGNNITCNSLQYFFFWIWKTILKTHRNSRHSVTIQTLREDYLCHK